MSGQQQCTASLPGGRLQRQGWWVGRAGMKMEWVGGACLAKTQAAVVYFKLPSLARCVHVCNNQSPS